MGNTLPRPLPGREGGQSSPRMGPQVPGRLLNGREAWTFVLLVWAYPLLPLGMAIGAWVAFAFRKHWLAAILSTITFLPPVVLILVMQIQTWIWKMNR